MWHYSPLLLLLLTGIARLDALPSIQLQPVVNGVPTDIQTVPWQVAVLQDGSLICGGAIVSKTLIITAADCLSNVTEVGQISVRAGSSFWQYGGQLVKALDFVVHEHHGKNSKENNIAIVKLGRAIDFSGNTPLSISIASESSENNALALVSGWGPHRREDPGSPTHLHSVTLKIIDRSTCAKALYAYNGFEITKDMICAEADGKSACGVDRGGPLTLNGTLVGIVSWNLGCPKRGYPGVYTDTVKLHEWIAKTMAELEKSSDL